MPGYLAYVTGMSGLDGHQTAGGRGRAAGRARMAAGTGLFVLVSALFAVYGTAYGTLGSALADHKQVITRGLRAVTMLLGLMLAVRLTGSRLPGGSSSRRSVRGRVGSIVRDRRFQPAMIPGLLQFQSAGHPGLRVTACFRPPPARLARTATVTPAAAPAKPEKMLR